MGANFLYFDTLCRDALENVVRFASRSPIATNWSTHIDVRRIIPLYSVQGELSSYLRSRFHKLWISRWKSDFHEQPTQHKDMLRTNVLKTAYDLVLQSGESFHTLIVESSYFNEPINSNMFKTFSERCPHISTLRTYRAGGWIEEFGEGLESLKIGYKQDFLEIPRYCAQLRELTLDFSIKRSDIEGTDLWMNLGNSLEKLSVIFIYECGNEIRNIAKYCRKLTELFIRGKGSNVALLECLVTYGSQLENTCISDMEEDELNHLIEACPNAKFDLTVFKRRLLISSLNILGCQLEKVRFRCYPECRPELEKVAVCWDNLQELKIMGDVELEDTSAVMATSKPVLRLLEFEVEKYTTQQQFQQVMDIVARSTGALEKISLWCSNPPRKAFDNLIKSNPSLCTVSLNFVSYISDDHVNNLIEKFLQIPALHEIELGYADKTYSTLELSEQVVDKLERRGVHFQTIF